MRYWQKVSSIMFRDVFRIGCRAEHWSAEHKVRFVEDLVVAHKSLFGAYYSGLILFGFGKVSRIFVEHF